ncbi:MAG: hypothetical protein ACI4HI_06230 [Lachnospiraceae bacterium]
MRILSPSGKIYEVNKILPYVEKKEEFNEKTFINREEAANPSVQPSALKLFFQGDEDGGIQMLYVGNMKPEKVREISLQLLRDGYYDFTVLEYQKRNPLCDGNLKIDQGKSKPYFDECIFDDVGNLFRNRQEILALEDIECEEE